MRSMSCDRQLNINTLDFIFDLMKKIVINLSGFEFRGTNYMCVRADKNSIYAKDEAKRGLVMVRTETLVAIATYSDVMYPAVCVEAMEKLRDYLKEKGK